jgi:hypothetical protein
MAWRLNLRGCMPERRDIEKRAELVRWVVTQIVQNPGVQITTDTMSKWLEVQDDVAERIVDHLVEAGLLREIRQGVWMRTTEL